MKNIVLTGFMGTGKTTAGKLVASKLGLSFVDVDAYIEKKAGMRISDIFEQFGEEYFRDLETECIGDIVQKKNLVIATGGGAVLRKKNVQLLRQNGVIVHLDATLDTILKHTSRSENRPLLQGQTAEQVKQRLASRTEFYQDCDFTVCVDGRTPIQVAQRIVECCKA